MLDKRSVSPTKKEQREEVKKRKGCLVKTTLSLVYNNRPQATRMRRLAAAATVPYLRTNSSTFSIAAFSPSAFLPPAVAK